MISRTRFCAPKPIARLASPASVAIGVTLMPNSGIAVSSAMPQTTLVPALNSIPANVRVCCSRAWAARVCEAARLMTRLVTTRNNRFRISATAIIPSTCRPFRSVNSDQWVKVKVLGIKLYRRASITLELRASRTRQALCLRAGRTKGGSR